MSTPDMVLANSGPSKRSLSTSVNRGERNAFARNSGFPVEKLSMAMTSSPRASKRSTRVLPMNPAPPVTSARKILLTYPNSMEDPWRVVDDDRVEQHDLMGPSGAL